MKKFSSILLLVLIVAAACSSDTSVLEEPSTTEQNTDLDSQDSEDVDSSDYWEMEAEDCLVGEEYDEEEKICFIECDTDEECDALAEEIYGEVNEFFVEDYSHSEDSQTSSEPEDADNTIAEYTLDANLELTSESGEEIASDHEQVWSYVSRILPRQTLTNEIDEFHIFTDGEDETLAYVAQTESDSSKWLIAVDIEDSKSVIETAVPDPDFVHTVVHEFGHIIALENDQVDPDYDFDSNSCTTPELSEGCPLESSYYARYYAEFWAGFGSEIPAEDDIEAIYAFYDRYSDEFVSEYAATNAVEDLAESFAAYVLKDSPTGNSIADQKVRFFSKFEELETIRSSIRSQLARS